jgi:geranylgeranyl reductase family protein
MIASDVIVVGAGPCGSFAALNLSALGKSVTVFEEHSQIGTPTHCAGHLSLKGLEQLGFPSLSKGVVENSFRGANFYSSKGFKFTVDFPEPVTCTVNREKFDKFIADKARNAGATYKLDSQVNSLKLTDGRTPTVMVKHEQKMELYQARIIIDAEGASSRLVKQAGIPTFHRFLLTAESEFDNIQDTELDRVDVYFGTKYADGLYAWLIPKKGGKAKVGLATRDGNPKELLQKLIRKHPVASKKLQHARMLESTFHMIPIGGPIAHPYSNGFIAVGDSASQVKPTTGGGVILGMNCARIAAEVISEALNSNDYSKEFLSKYESRCNKFLGFNMKVMIMLRNMLDTLTDTKMDQFIALSSRLKLEMALRNTKDIDFPGKTLLQALPNPRTIVMLSYLLYSYLSVNFKIPNC